MRTSVSNVLVIGSGAAGLRAAISADESGTEVMVIGKRQRRDAHTVLASGGINAALGTRDPEDSWQQHFTALSIAYMAVWFLGDAGLKLFTSAVDIPLFLVLDVASDTGLGILSVVLIERLSNHVDAEPGETSIAASARMARNE